MQGSVDWGQLIFMGGIVLAVATFMFFFAWRTQEIRAKDREGQRSSFQQEISSVHELIKMVQKDLDARLRTIEMSNAGILVVLKHMEEFKKEVMEKFETMNDSLTDDMELLNRRLDDMHNAARMINATREPQ